MTVTRIEKSKRMSQGVRHGDTIYLAGQVAGNPLPDVKAQTADVLTKIDGLLAQLGSSKASLLSATIFLPDIRHFQAMNEVWDSWIDPENPPVRACVEANLAATQYMVEICVIAAAG